MLAVLSALDVLANEFTLGAVSELGSSSAEWGGTGPMPSLAMLAIFRPLRASAHLLRGSLSHISGTSAGADFRAMSSLVCNVLLIFIDRVAI